MAVHTKESTAISIKQHQYSLLQQEAQNWRLPKLAPGQKIAFWASIRTSHKSIPKSLCGWKLSPLSWVSVGSYLVKFRVRKNPGEYKGSDHRMPFIGCTALYPTQHIWHFPLDIFPFLIWRRTWRRNLRPNFGRWLKIPIVANLTGESEIILKSKVDQVGSYRNS